MRRRMFGATAGAIAVLGSIPSQSAQASPIVIKFSHVVTPDTPKGRAAELFKQLAEQRTNGAVKVEIYPNSQLYNDKEEVEMLQLGAVQMLAPSTGKFGPLGIKEFEAFDLPFIFPNRAVMRRVTEGPIGRGLFKMFESKGILGLAYWENGFKIMTSNRPMHRPEDLKGLKIRVQSSKVCEAQFRELGALPQVMAFSELYQALQTGVVDGEESPPSNVYTQKLHEVQKHATMTNHGYIGYAVIVNKKFWKGLRPDTREKLEAALAEATEYEHQIAQQDNADALAAMKATGKTTFYDPNEEETEAWRRALVPVQKEMASRVGKDLVAAINKEAEVASVND